MKRALFFVTVLCLMSCASIGQDSLSKKYFIKFSGYSSHLSKKAKTTLDSLSGVMKSKAAYYCIITNNCTSENEQMNIAIWDRMSKAVNYLVNQKGISKERFVFRYGTETNDCNEIAMLFTTEKEETPLSRPRVQRKNNRL